VRVSAPGCDNVVTTDIPVDSLGAAGEFKQPRRDSNPECSPGKRRGLFIQIIGYCTLVHVLHPEVLNAPSLALIVTVVGPLPMLLAMIELVLPLVSVSRSQ
jgi:hypothetical protein